MFKAIRKAFGGSNNEQNTTPTPQRPETCQRPRTHSRPGSSPRPKSRAQTRRKTVNVPQGDYVAKQKVTLWNYGNGGTTLIPYNVPEKAELEVKRKCSHFLSILFQFLLNFPFDFKPFPSATERWREMVDDEDGELGWKTEDPRLCGQILFC